MATLQDLRDNEAGWKELTLSRAGLSQHIEKTRYRPHEAPTVLSVSVDVANTGSRDGDEVLLAFAVPPNAGLGGAPLRSLVQYERVHVKRGGVERVTLRFTAHHFALSDAAGVTEISVGTWALEIGKGATVVVHCA